MSDCRRVDQLADRIEAQVVVSPFFSDERPPRGPQGLLDWRLDGLLSTMLARGEACGLPGEKILVASNGKILAQWALFIGAGERAGFCASRFDDYLKNLFKACYNARFFQIALCFDELDGIAPDIIEEKVRQLLSQRDLAGFDCILTIAAAKTL